VRTQFNIPLSNLRAIVIIIVVAFHSALPYLTSAPAHPAAFDQAPYRWVAFPITDQERWFGFDLFCAWQDVSLMSLMFFLAGLFTPASLARKGSFTYFIDRWWRIGLPFCLAAAILSPLAYFASYRASGADPSIAGFWEAWLNLPMWPAGPAWFLWQLFALSALAAVLRAFAPNGLEILRRIADASTDHPFAFFAGLTALGLLAYVPLAMTFTPWHWSSWGPFSIQLCRPLHYLLYFFVGFAIGASDLDRGILRTDGPLARRWLIWVFLAVASFALWGGLTSLTLQGWDTSPLAYRLGSAFAFPLACTTGIACMLAISLRLMRMQDSRLDSLSQNAYGIYLVHYVFVVWLQYAMLSVPLDAIGKAALVFAAALLLSWATSCAWAALKPMHFAVSGRRAIADQAR
jgi:glucan biosynthesis protein C